MVWVLLAAGVAGVVVQPVADMHASPAEDAEVISQAIYGSPLELLARKDGWFRVRTEDGYEGWMRAAALRRLAPGEAPYASRGATARVASLFANLYYEPDVTRRAPLATIPFESRLEIAWESEAEQRRWLQVRLPDGRTAWIQRGDLSSDAAPLGIAELVEFARRFIGLPYRWGGTSTFGYDCSGFTQMLLRQRRVLIPRDAAPQMSWSGFIAVDRENLQPGDLLFFGSSPDKVTHSGMYLGNGEFIHATTWGRPVVQVSRLDDPHWAQLLVACRRLK